jgi:uncharacterized protein (DUF2236 family)
MVAGIERLGIGFEEVAGVGFQLLQGHGHDLGTVCEKEDGVANSDTRPSAPVRNQAPGPGSLTWRLMGDARGLLLAPTTLVLQVAHPVVGAGVSDHSDFPRDAWGRLLRTVNSAVRFTYGDDAQAAAEAERLRAVHLRIQGVDHRGRPYHALDPAAYAWVHLTLARLGVETRRLFGRPLAEDELERFYAEWRRVGLRLGVRDSEMPATWGAYAVYFDRVVADVLEVNDAVLEVLEAVRRPPSPAGWLPDPLWAPAALGAGAVQTTFTLGTLPPPLRDALGVRWTAIDQARLQAYSRAVRLAGRAIPPPLRYVPQVAPHAIRAWRASLGPLTRRIAS